VKGFERIPFFMANFLEHPKPTPDRGEVCDASAQIDKSFSKNFNGFFRGNRKEFYTLAL
jgi:hypothetical protein